jgi:hypothetical protein
MMRILTLSLIVTGFLFLSAYGIGLLTDSIPNEIKQPGTQSLEVSTLESVNYCNTCHGGYNQAVEPVYNWMGSMMAHASRDPLFWATLAIAEQDYPGAGDLCLRCHTARGWLADRSEPTDGSAMLAADANGVECDLCHRLTNPDDSEHIGVQYPPFVANDGGNPPVGYYGSGMASVWNGTRKLGPYNATMPYWHTEKSQFHRSVDFCGTCHDVSNPAVGDLAHNNGAQDTADPVTSSGVPGAPVEEKAAFNNFPFQYGIVERTFSEYKAGLLSQTLVSDYDSLPDDLKGGVIHEAYEKALAAGKGGNYQDGTPRYFSCQTCHLHPSTGKGSNMHMSPTRKDLPNHHMAGGNYWMPDAILYLNSRGNLKLGGSLTAIQIAALKDGIEGTKEELEEAAALQLNGNMLKVINRTGHKLITGYPEGRRMWLNIKWYDDQGALLREDGAYGSLTVNLDGAPVEVDTILDLDDPNTRIYEAHCGMTQEWANQLLGLGWSLDHPLGFDRVSGDVDFTLGDLASQAPGTHHETFHFVLNNEVVKDNRIPPYGMDYEEARVRNALPVPADQYGDPGPGGAYNYWDVVQLNPPVQADTAEISLLYQPTSWEYIQFLYLANDGLNPFLADVGENLLDAWLNTGMASPHAMASTTWTNPHTIAVDTHTLSESAGGIVNFVLDAGIENANRKYLVLGSATGTFPGTALPGELAILPLNWDPFTDVVLLLVNSPVFMDFMGQLDATGVGAAMLDIPGPLPPGYVGTLLYFGYALNNPWNFASNAEYIEIVP